jgi:hypothetical protein
MFLKKIFNVSNYALLTALTLSAIAAWYSIQGLMAIFAAAVIPIVVMGSSLEVAKVVTTIWLHDYWSRAGWKLKLYLVPAVAILALITSMGIFGFLSKAHMDQTVPSGDVAAQVNILDEKIKTEHDNIDAAKKALQQMDAQVDQMLGRTDTDKGAERAVQIRRQQAKERNNLQKDIQNSQANIVKLQEERAPIASKLRKVEAEVGPIKYIAALIYGDNPDQNLLERAVRWVIIILVLVFDPLALCLVIAAITSREWDYESWKKKEKLIISDIVEPIKETTNEVPTYPVKDNTTTESVPEIINCYRCDTPLVNMPGIGLFCPNKECGVIDNLDDSEEKELSSDIVEAYQHIVEPTITSDTNVTLDQLNNIQTEGVTQENLVTPSDGGYVKYSNKLYQENALKELRPDLSAHIDNSNNVSTNFGTAFPLIAKKGNVFVRVDALPNRVFKFDGNKWIELNKTMTDTHLYNQDYVQFLIDKIDKGEYDVEHLTEIEAAAIEDYLKNKK